MRWLQNGLNLRTIKCITRGYFSIFPKECIPLSLDNKFKNSKKSTKLDKLPENPTELVVYVSRAIESQLADLGLKGGNGIVEKLSPHSIDPLIKDRVRQISRVRNFVVHGTNLNVSEQKQSSPHAQQMYNRTLFVAAFHDVYVYLENIKKIVSSKEFIETYHREKADSNQSILSYAEVYRKNNKN